MICWCGLVTLAAIHWRSAAEYLPTPGASSLAIERALVTAGGEQSDNPQPTDVRLALISEWQPQLEQPLVAWATALGVLAGLALMRGRQRRGLQRRGWKRRGLQSTGCILAASALFVTGVAFSANCRDGDHYCRNATAYPRQSLASAGIFHELYASNSPAYRTDAHAHWPEFHRAGDSRRPCCGTGIRRMPA